MSATTGDDVLRARLGRPIRGPSAFGGGLRRFANLTYTLAVTDFKLKFFGSVLGYVWQLVKPLALFAVMYAVFTHVLKIGQGVAFYPAILIANIVLFTFFSEVTTGGVTSVVDRETIVRKVHFPRLVIPLATMLTGFFNLLLNLVAVLVFCVAAGVSLHASIIEAPFLILALAVFTAGVAMIVAALYVPFRDVKPIWEVFSQALYFATPIIYVIEKVAEHQTIVHVIMASPIAVVLVQFRHAVIDPSAPSAVAASGGWVWMLIPLAIWIGTIALGVWYFDRAAPRIAEEL